jgi:hypothetical protein
MRHLPEAHALAILDLAQPPSFDLQMASVQPEKAR